MTSHCHKAEFHVARLVFTSSDDRLSESGQDLSQWCLTMDSGQLIVQCHAVSKSPGEPSQ